MPKKIAFLAILALMIVSLSGCLEGCRELLPANVETNLVRIQEETDKAILEAQEAADNIKNEVIKQKENLDKKIQEINDAAESIKEASEAVGEAIEKSKEVVK